MYVTFTPANYPPRIVLDAKNLHGSFWTKLSVLAFIPTHNEGQNCVISGEVDENCALLGNYAATTGNSLPTFRYNLSIPSSRMMNPKKTNKQKKLKMGPTHCPETSVRNHHYSLRNSPQERSSQRWTELPVSTLKGSNILEHDVLRFVKNFQLFRRGLAPPFSGSMHFKKTIVNEHWLREQQASSK